MNQNAAPIAKIAAITTAPAIQPAFSSTAEPVHSSRVELTAVPPAPQFI